MARTRERNDLFSVRILGRPPGSPVWITRSVPPLRRTKAEIAPGSGDRSMPQKYADPTYASLSSEASSDCMQSCDEG